MILSRNPNVVKVCKMLVSAINIASSRMALKHALRSNEIKLVSTFLITIQRITNFSNENYWFMNLAWGPLSGNLMKALLIRSVSILSSQQALICLMLWNVV